MLKRFAACFVDGKSVRRINHPIEELVAQRVYGIALDYEDVNDLEQLRRDPLLAVMAGRPETASALVDKSTLNRLELSTKKADRYKKIQWDTESIDRLLVDVFLEAHR